jgi:hypothetical protein
VIDGGAPAVPPNAVNDGSETVRLFVTLFAPKLSRGNSKPDGLKPSNPLLTMESRQQALATHGKRISLVSRFQGLAEFASGCHWLRPLGSIKAPS